MNDPTPLSALDPEAGADPYLLAADAPPPAPQAFPEPLEVIRVTAASARAFTVKAPEGSILNPTYPAAVNLRTRTGWYIAPNIFMALAKAAPDMVQSFTGLAVAANVYGMGADGQYYSDLLFCGGGQGGSDRKDGHSSLLWPTSAANTSIELMESRVPVLVLEKAFLADSGGAGRHRGGLGQVVRFRKRDDDGLEMLVSVYPEGVDNPIPGLSGGQAGGGARGLVQGADGRLVRDCCSAPKKRSVSVTKTVPDFHS